MPESQEAVPIVRETCVRCAMIANLDPHLHMQRYGHRPEVRRSDGVYRFSDYTHAFTWKIK